MTKKGRKRSKIKTRSRSEGLSRRWEVHVLLTKLRQYSGQVTSPSKSDTRRVEFFALWLSVHCSAHRSVVVVAAASLQAARAAKMNYTLVR